MTDKVYPPTRKEYRDLVIALARTVPDSDQRLWELAQKARDLIAREPEHE